MLGIVGGVFGFLMGVFGPYIVYLMQLSPPPALALLQSVLVITSLLVSFSGLVYVEGTKNLGQIRERVESAYRETLARAKTGALPEEGLPLLEKRLEGLLDSMIGDLKRINLSLGFDMKVLFVSSAVSIVFPMLQMLFLYVFSFFVLWTFGLLFEVVSFGYLTYAMSGISKVGLERTYQRLDEFSSLSLRSA
ncbi:MAG TPA: hypothetical protein VGR53_11165 [Nitrososphaerales archaeon]|nr:hypothetical protein [Nitrososphaerales archaeon]